MVTDYVQETEQVMALEVNLREKEGATASAAVQQLCLITSSGRTSRALLTFPFEAQVLPYGSFAFLTFGYLL
ncbi:hypothetical protein V6N13_036214 [Hibiscus sabdariffa]|uniref:Uncharacterized protein n=1 Tax=Hibiscus sabdariffa TaxID=183260 RepID=A0ABR2S7R6_9ROSI